MKAESDLKILAREMQPFLHPQAVVFAVLSQPTSPNLSLDPIATFREEEGITVILPQSEAEQFGLPFEGLWAWITLQVHSALDAVGFLAKISVALAQAGISVNVFSAYYHDHLFVPWERRFEAMEVLERIRQNAP